jgi:hypothetical protein
MCDTIDHRERRGLEIEERLPITRDGDDLWLVPSQFTPGTVYRVTLDAPSCTCLDHAEHRGVCKHIVAARAARTRAMGGTPPKPQYPAVLPEGAPPWITADMIRRTIAVFQFFYRELLTPEEAMEMILRVSLLFDLRSPLEAGEATG